MKAFHTSGVRNFHDLEKQDSGRGNMLSPVSTKKQLSPNDV